MRYPKDIRWRDHSHTLIVSLSDTTEFKEQRLLTDYPPKHVVSLPAQEGIQCRKDPLPDNLDYPEPSQLTTVGLLLGQALCWYLPVLYSYDDE